MTRSSWPRASEPPGVALGARTLSRAPPSSCPTRGRRAPSTSYAATLAGPADVLLVGTGLTMVDVVLSLTGTLAAARPPRPCGLAARGAARSGTPTSSSWPRSPRSTTGARPSRTTAGVRPSTSPGSSARPATGDPRSTACAPSSRRSGSGSTRTTAPSSSAPTPAHGAGRATGCLRGRPTWSPRSGPRGTLTLGCRRGRRRRAAHRRRAARHAHRRHVREVGWVVNCTGTSTVVQPGTDPLVDDLLTPRAGVSLGRLSTAGLGLPDAESGRLVDSVGSTEAPIWTLGSVRRGELLRVHRDPRDPHPGRPGRGRRARRDRARAPAARRRPAGRRAPPGRPPARPARAAAVDHGGGGRGVQRRARAADAAAVRRRREAPRGRRARPRLRASPMPRWRCSATRPGRRVDVGGVAGGGRSGPRASGPTTASAAWSTWSAAGSRTSATPAPRP